MQNWQETPVRIIKQAQLFTDTYVPQYQTDEGDWRSFRHEDGEIVFGSWFESALHFLRKRTGLPLNGAAQVVWSSKEGE